MRASGAIYVKEGHTIKEGDEITIAYGNMFFVRRPLLEQMQKRKPRAAPGKSIPSEGRGMAPSKALFTTPQRRVSTYRFRGLRFDEFGTLIACRVGHPMTLNSPPPDLNCDICNCSLDSTADGANGTDGEEDDSTRRKCYSCHTCDFDVCKICARPGGKTHRPESP